MKIQYMSRSNSWCVKAVSLALMSIACGLAQPNSQTKSVSTVAEVLALAGEPGVRIDYMRVHRMLNTLEPDDRKIALKGLIESRNEELSVDVALMAIAEPGADYVGAIASRIVGWLPTNQTVILHRLAPARERFMQVPRKLVRSVLDDPKEAGDPEPGSAAVEPVGLSAILLAGTGNKADYQMILDLAQLRPRSWGVWMAVAYAGILDGPRAKLASAVYRDPSVPLPVRVAAASGLGPADPLAEAFAASQVELFLARFDNLDLASMLRAAMDAKPEGDAHRLYWQLILDLHLATALLVLDEHTAEPLTTRFLKANNQYVRNLCGIVAARRWPDRILKLGQGAFSEKEYAALLALIAQYHPEQAAAAAAMTPDGLAKAKSDLREFGLGVFGLPGGLIEVFSVNH